MYSTVNNCHSETCKHVKDTVYDSVFCECNLCNSSFWQPYKYLFNSDGLSDTHVIDTSASEKTQKDSKLSDSEFFSSSEPFNTLRLTGSEMASHLPRIFDVFALQAFQATQQPDGLQVSAQWVELIEGLPMLSDRFYYHLFQRNERCLEMILCSVAMVLLAILTKWPTSPTPTMECARSYFKQSVWKPDGMILGYIPIKLLRLALFALGKCSQRRYPIKKFNHLLHLNIGGVYFVKTHYSSLLNCGRLLISS